ncbi:MAG: hypothetical protein LBE76_05505 [Nitrososphaerota archaeon]|jgi:hypothetical protein|nr:hypothetical protein [Nitrososphaerota archaeon]
MFENKTSSKKVVFWGATLFMFVIALSFTAGTMTNAVYTYVTGDWQTPVLGLSIAGITGTVGTAIGASAAGSTVGAMASGALTAMGPVGWAIIGVCVAGL